MDVDEAPSRSQEAFVLDDSPIDLYAISREERYQIYDRIVNKRHEIRIEGPSGQGVFAELLEAHPTLQKEVQEDWFEQYKPEEKMKKQKRSGRDKGREKKDEKRADVFKLCKSKHHGIISPNTTRFKAFGARWAPWHLTQWKVTNLFDSWIDRIRKKKNGSIRRLAEILPRVCSRIDPQRRVDIRLKFYLEAIRAERREVVQTIEDTGSQSEGKATAPPHRHISKTRGCIDLTYDSQEEAGISLTESSSQRSLSRVPGGRTKQVRSSPARRLGPITSQQKPVQIRIRNFSTPKGSQTASELSISPSNNLDQRLALQNTMDPNTIPDEVLFDLINFNPEDPIPPTADLNNPPAQPDVLSGNHSIQTNEQVDLPLQPERNQDVQTPNGTEPPPTKCSDQISNHGQFPPVRSDTNLAGSTQKLTVRQVFQASSISSQASYQMESSLMLFEQHGTTPQANTVSHEQRHEMAQANITSGYGPTNSDSFLSNSQASRNPVLRTTSSPSSHTGGADSTFTSYSNSPLSANSNPSFSNYSTPPSGFITLQFTPPNYGRPTIYSGYANQAIPQNTQASFSQPTGPYQDHMQQGFYMQTSTSNVIPYASNINNIPINRVTNGRMRRKPELWEKVHKSYEANVRRNKRFNAQEKEHIERYYSGYYQASCDRAWTEANTMRRIVESHYRLPKLPNNSAGESIELEEQLQMAYPMYRQESQSVVPNFNGSFPAQLSGHHRLYSQAVNPGIPTAMQNIPSNYMSSRFRSVSAVSLGHHYPSNTPADVAKPMMRTQSDNLGMHSSPCAFGNPFQSGGQGTMASPMPPNNFPNQADCQIQVSVFGPNAQGTMEWPLPAQNLANQMDWLDPALAAPEDLFTNSQASVPPPQ